MQPDLVWIKNREEETSDDTHFWFDSVRGVTKYLISSGDGAQVTDADTLDAFQSDGFKVDDDVKCNTSSEKYVAFCWKESTDAGFDIVSYTGNATARTISHNLSAIPETIICKETSASAPFGNQAWSVYHKGITANKYMVFNATQAEADDAADFNDTDPTSSVFSVGNGNRCNASGGAQLAFIFAPKQGFSKFSYFLGNGNANGTFFYTGFRPAFVIIKDTGASVGWGMYDNKRNGHNPDNKTLYVQSDSGEDAGGYVDFKSNGIKITSSSAWQNRNGGKFIYWAWAEAPFVNSKGVPCTAR